VIRFFGAQSRLVGDSDKVTPVAKRGFVGEVDKEDAGEEGVDGDENEEDGSVDQEDEDVDEVVVVVDVTLKRCRRSVVHDPLLLLLLGLRVSLLPVPLLMLFASW
jgi:hypothetical protein